MSTPIEIINRATGEVERELIHSEAGLRFLYEDPWGRTVSDTVLQWPIISQVFGMLQRRPASRHKIPDFIERLGIDPTQAVRAIEDFESMDDFFTRHLKPEARPVDMDPNHLISPADGRVLVFDDIPESMNIKGSPVTLTELLGDEAMAAKYRHGSLVVVRLAPADYHRFHFPEAGEAGTPRREGTGLYSVHPIALQSGATAFKNLREITELRTQSFGTIVLIEVGALFVGTIEQTYQPGMVTRGQEKGTFHFGGSTVVMVLEPNKIKWDDDLVQASARGMETLLKCGERIAVRA